MTQKKDAILMGNFTTKREVVPASDQTQAKVDLVAKVREGALASLGGSMVYMERKKLTWDGNEA